MKRIIGGMTYDTGTAERVAEYSHGYPGDADHYTEGLYLTRKGTFFLAGSGGGRSYYATLFREGMARTDADIIPLAAEEALRWLEDHDRTEEIERLFGEQPEAGNGTTVLCIRVSDDMKRRVEEAAEKASCGTGVWLIRAIERGLSE